MSYNRYYKEVKQVSYDNGETWENFIDSEGNYVFRKGDLYQSNLTSCDDDFFGIRIYDWIEVPYDENDPSTWVELSCPESISTTMWCEKWSVQVYSYSEDNGVTWIAVVDDEGNKRYRQGNILIAKRTFDWIEIPYDENDPSTWVCEPCEKWSKQVYSYSEDDGETWIEAIDDEGNKRYRKGNILIENDSADCGYRLRSLEVNNKFTDSEVCVFTEVKRDYPTNTQEYIHIKAYDGDILNLELHVGNNIARFIAKKGDNFLTIKYGIFTDIIEGNELEIKFNYGEFISNVNNVPLSYYYPASKSYKIYLNSGHNSDWDAGYRHSIEVIDFPNSISINYLNYVGIDINHSFCDKFRELNLSQFVELHLYIDSTDNKLDLSREDNIAIYLNFNFHTHAKELDVSGWQLYTTDTNPRYLFDSYCVVTYLETLKWDRNNLLYGEYYNSSYAPLCYLGYHIPNIKTIYAKKVNDNDNWLIKKMIEDQKLKITLIED